MATIMRTLFPTKRRKTEDISPVVLNEANGIMPTSSSSISLTGFLNDGRSVSSASHRRQHSTGSGSAQQQQQEQNYRFLHQRNGRRRDSNNYNNNNNNGSVPVIPYMVPMSKLCTKSSTTLKTSDLRMVIIEAEQRVLYDTLTVIPVRNGVVPNVKQMSACKEFQFLRRRRDTKTLAQLLFGAVPTATGSESFKIHILEDEDKILVSKVFLISRHIKEQASSDSDSQSTIKSADGWNMRPHSTRSTTSTPETFSRIRHISINYGDDEDCAASSSLASSLNSPRAFSPPHRLSRNRRRQMAHKTSLSENTFAIPSSIKSRSRLSSIGSHVHDDENGHGQSRQVALGLLFPAAQRHFLFQHMPLIEAEMSRFENRIMTSAGHPPTFLHNISKSWDELADTICCLHNAPRIKNPVWLSLNECRTDDKHLARQFCNQMAYLVRKFDTKEHGYFLSNLITAILMHHMSWVASVASPPVRHDARMRESASMKNLLFGMNLNEDAHSVGYNAQMAQYLELNGNVGLHRSAKVVMCGEDAEILSAVCQVLTYFIRCSAVKHVDDERLWELPVEQAFSPINASETPDSIASTSSSCRMAYSPEKDIFVKPATAVTSSSSSVESLPVGVVEQSTSICVLDSDVTSAITIINRLEYPCCGENTHGSSTELWSPRPYSDGLGRSLFAGPLASYCPHFVVSAILKSSVNMTETISKMFDEVRCTDSPCHRAVATASLSSSQSSSVCDVQMPENVLIVADVDEHTVKIMSSEGLDEVSSPSDAVVSMLEQFVGLHTAVPVTPEFLVSVIEDSLAHIVGKSLTLVEMVARDGRTPQMSPDRVRTIIGCDHSDLRLIVNVAAVYWPPVLSSVFG